MLPQQVLVQVQSHEDQSVNPLRKLAHAINRDFFLVVKIEKFHQKNFDIFPIFAQNIDCGYTLEPPRRGGSNEYPQFMFWSKNKKNRYTPANPSFTIQKWGLRGYTLHGHVFLMHDELARTLFQKRFLAQT